MKIVLRILKWTAIVLIVLFAGLAIAANMMYDRKYDAPYPDIKASSDSAIIAHGQHLVLSTAHCAECHFKPDDSTKVKNGEDFQLAGGGFPFLFPGGAFYSRNISSDKETGIGNLKDGEIARALRYGVKHDGTVLIPAMEYQNLSDEDLTAIISYLRTIPAVSHKVPDNDFNLFGKAILAFLIRPESPVKTPPAKMTPDTTAQYGEYLARFVSGCRSCHTERNPNTGAYIGEELAGGPFEQVKGDPPRMLYTANLTPDPTGVLHDWTFEKFRDRFHQGTSIPESVMPWFAFKKLNDTELRALWKYLHTIKPVHHDVGAYVQLIKK
ncbi:MAG: cytochrome c [Saprospiraceae bacterium]